MSDDRCIWTGSKTPRALSARHLDDCADDACRGCQPCPERHCICCGIIHVTGSATETHPESISSSVVGPSATDSLEGPQIGTQRFDGEQTCPGCIGAVRRDLETIVDLCRRLPDEAAHHAQDRRPEQDHVLGGDAMVMLVGHNIDGDALPGDPLPPLAVLASWEDDWRETFDHGAAGRATITAAAAYLDRHLDRAAHEHLAFDEFATEIRQCRSRLEDVLHDGIRDRKGAPCLYCDVPLRRAYGDHGLEDDWRCPRCRRTWDHETYLGLIAHRAERAKLADIDGELWATVDLAARMLGRPHRTIRTWIEREDIPRACPLTGQRERFYVPYATLAKLAGMPEAT